MTLQNLEAYSVADLKLIEKALEYACEKHAGVYRKSGEPYIIHPIEVANILILSGEDVKCIMAGLLHDVLEDTDTSIAELASVFGWQVANIVDGVTKMKLIIKDGSKDYDFDLSTIRKLFVMATRDVRIIKVKLADRLHNMRTLEYMSFEKQYQKSLETMQVYVPLAEQIGAFRIKKELEDLSVQYLDPEKYKCLTKEVDWLIQNEYISSVKESASRIDSLLKEENIEGDIVIRPKNIGGIYRFLKQNPNIGDIHDLVSLKILLSKVKDCYQSLGIINQAYRANSVVKDYITNPKPNGYQSLHTTIFLPKPTLVKIRTKEQDKIATYGLNSEMYKQKDWFKVIECLNATAKDDVDFWENTQKLMTEQKIYVYTATGEMKELPKGATVIDFAYSIHTYLGNHLSSARVNDSVVDVKYPLQNFDHVEVLTDEKRAVPGSDWENYAVTPLARYKIRKARHCD